MSVHQIIYGTGEDDFVEFDAMRGRLQPRNEQPEVIVRPGKDGQIIRLTGVRGVPVRITTKHHVADWTAAKSAIDFYGSLIGGETPVEIVQNDVSYGYFEILEVVEIEALPCINARGTIISNPTVIQFCGWTVLSVEYTPPP